MQENLIIIESQVKGERLDKFLASMLEGYSRSQVQELIIAGQVFYDKKIITNPASKTQIGPYKINLSYLKTKPSHLVPYDFSLNVVYEDEYLMVINKPAELIVHPGAGNFDKTLANALIHYAKGNLSSVAGEFRPGIVHRLDKDTSGLIMIAKDDQTHKYLSEALALREIKRQYLALVFGSPSLLAGTIKTKIAKNKRDHSKMIVTKATGKDAITHYVLQETLPDKKFSIIECQLDTGRTHQIRVHLNYKGLPVVGDQTYNDGQTKYLLRLTDEAKTLVSSFKRQALHAYRLKFVHPITDELMEFEIDLADDIKELWQQLKNLSA